MTAEKLIEALQQECRTDRVKVEDFLSALADLCVESLRAGESFRLRGIGAFTVSRRLSPKTNKIRFSLVFQVSDKMRARLDLPADEPIRKTRGLCKTCGLKPGKVQIYDECGRCMRRKSS